MFEKGKPVLCEKPLTMNVADTESLISAAREKGLFFMEVCIARSLCDASCCCDPQKYESDLL